MDPNTVLILLEAYLRDPRANMNAKERLALTKLLTFAHQNLSLFKKVSK